MTKLSALGFTQDDLPQQALEALTAEFPLKPKDNKASATVRVSPTAVRVAREEWRGMWANDLQFESIPHAVEYLLQGVRVAIKQLAEETPS